MGWWVNGCAVGDENGRSIFDLQICEHARWADLKYGLKDVYAHQIYSYEQHYKSIVKELLFATENVKNKESKERIGSVLVFGQSGLRICLFWPKPNWLL